MDKSVKLNIKALAAMKNLSIAELAKEIGLSQSMLSSLEHGSREGSDTTKIKIAKFYGKSVDYIFFASKIT